jgi:hypothetical protein
MSPVASGRPQFAWARGSRRRRAETGVRRPWSFSLVLEHPKGTTVCEYRAKVAGPWLNRSGLRPAARSREGGMDTVGKPRGDEGSQSVLQPSSDPYQSNGQEPERDQITAPQPDRHPERPC